MENRRSLICDNIPEGLQRIKAEVTSGKLFQVDICQGGVIQTVHRFGADAAVKVEEITKECMFININSYNVRLMSPLRITWMDPGTDPYYEIIVWLMSGLEAVFFIWA